MLTADELNQRQTEIQAAPDLAALLRRLTERARPVLERMPPIPRAKALLTADGGVCPRDGIRLEFNPWSPAEHRCSHCRQSYQGERHDRAWAHYQHLWLAERTAHLATVAVMADFFVDIAKMHEFAQNFSVYKYKILTFNEFHRVITTVLVQSSHNHEFQSIFLKIITVAAR